MRFVPGFLVLAATAAATAVAVWALGARLRPDSGQAGAWTEKRLAEATLQGKSVLFPAQVDEAMLRWLTAEMLEEAPDIALLGSSHGLQISSDFARPYRLQNFAISGAGFPDHLVTTEILHQRARRPRVWAVFVDPWFFDGTLDFLMWKPRAAHLTAMEARLAAREGAPFPTVFRERVQEVIRPKLGARFSLEPVLAGLDDLYQRHADTVVETTPGDALGTVLRPDGAIEPAGGRTEIDAAEARALALTQYAQNRDRHRYGTFGRVDEEIWNVFEAWVALLHAEDSRVIFLLSPYHPAIHPKALADPRNHLVAIEARVRELASRNGILVLGSYDPARAGMTESQFVDGDHLRAEGLRHLLGTHLSEAATPARP